jgi:hypothetical protein
MEAPVAIPIGTILALLVGLMAMADDLDRDRAFYPRVTIIVASYYVLFAVMGASTETLLMELLVGAGFVIAAAAYLAWLLRSGRNREAAP